MDWHKKEQLGATVRRFCESVNLRDRHHAVKALHELNDSAAKDRGAALRELLGQYRPLAAMLTVALKCAESSPCDQAALSQLHALRNYTGIWTH